MFRGPPKLVRWFQSVPGVSRGCPSLGPPAQVPPTKFGTSLSPGSASLSTFLSEKWQQRRPSLRSSTAQCDRQPRYENVNPESHGLKHLPGSCRKLICKRYSSRCVVLCFSCQRPQFLCDLVTASPVAHHPTHCLIPLAQAIDLCDRPCLSLLLFEQEASCTSHGVLGALAE